MFYFSKKVRLFSQNDVLFLFYFLINPTMTTGHLNFDKIDDVIQITIEDVVWVVV